MVIPGSSEQSVVGDIGASTDWQAALEGVDFVVHAAARAHRVNDPIENAGQYTATNAEGTACLATAAARSGARRLLFLSSVKVNGEESNRAYTAHDEPEPQGAYAQSKWLAEQRLNEIAARTGMETVIVRPPLVYGPGVRANFLRLMRWVAAGYPLPLGSVVNRRSLVSVWNLCDLLVHALEVPAAANATWLVSDGDDLSTPDLVRRIASAMHRPARLFPVPESVLRTLGKLTGQQAAVSRLCGSLRVDIEPTRTVLGWSPITSVEEGLSRTVAWYLSVGRQC